MRRFISIPVLGAALLAPVRPLYAQQAADAWEVGVDLGLNATRGNSHLTLFSTTIEVSRLETDRYELSWTAKGLYGENADSVVARRYQSGLNFDWRPEARVSPFVFVNAERDKFRKLEVRTNAGTGAKYTLWRAERTSGSISAAVLHDYQAFTASLPGGGSSTSAARWSVRSKTKAELANGVVLENVTFFKPVFDDIEDYDVDATTKASFKVSDRIAVTLSWALRYDSTPPLEVRRDDQVLQFGLSLDL